MSWFFVVSALMLILSMVYVWKAKEYLRDEMRICRNLQNESHHMYDTLSNVMYEQRNKIRGWEHRLEIMHNDIRKLKKELSVRQGGDTNVQET